MCNLRPETFVKETLAAVHVVIGQAGYVMLPVGCPGTWYVTGPVLQMDVIQSRRLEHLVLMTVVSLS